MVDTGASIRPGARYYHSLRRLDQAKRLDPTVFTKSGLMLGVGETREEIDEIREAAGPDVAVAEQLIVEFYSK